MQLAGQSTHHLPGLVIALAVTGAILFLPSTAAGRSEASAESTLAWAVGLEGGAVVPFPSNAQTTRGTVELSLSRLLWRHLDLDLALQVGLSKISTDLVISSRAGLHLAWRNLAVSVGCRLGYAAVHVDKGSLGSLWTGALLTNPGIVVTYGLWRRFELTAELLTISLYYNEVWMVSWEPSAGFGVRF
jgi:hypothetical protein